LLASVCSGAAEETVVSAAQQARSGTETRSSTEADGEAADAGVTSGDGRRGTHEYSRRGAARFYGRQARRDRYGAYEYSGRSEARYVHYGEDWWRDRCGRRKNRHDDWRKNGDDGRRQDRRRGRSEGR
jgi:hypothetical protein